MHYVCPAAGLLIATLMFFAPYRDLKAAIERGHLGTLNPTPWVFMFGNCLGWVIYSILKRNFWIFFSNCPGLILSVWLNLGAVKLLYQGHFSTEMRKSFAAYLEAESKRRQEEEFRKLIPGHRRKRSFSQSVRDIFTGSSGIEDIPAHNAAELEALANEGGNDDLTAPTHKRSPSGTVADAVAEIFTGPVVGPGRKRTLSMDVAAEAFIANAAATDKAPSSSADDDPENNGPETVGEAVADAVEAVTDFAKVVWDVTAQTTPAPAPHERLVMYIVLLWTVVVCIICFANKISMENKAFIVGVVTNFNLVFFYGAPLSTVFIVLTERNSESIHIPTMITNTMSSSFWMVYGLAIGDWFVAAPNALGSALGGIQIMLYLMFPRSCPSAVLPIEAKMGSEELSTAAGSHTSHSPTSVLPATERIITSVEQLNRDLENPPLAGQTDFVPEPLVILEHKTLEVDAEAC